jgi:hypothetical protein
MMRTILLTLAALSLVLPSLASAQSGPVIYGGSARVDPVYGWMSDDTDTDDIVIGAGVAVGITTMTSRALDPTGFVTFVDDATADKLCVGADGEYNIDLTLGGFSGTIGATYTTSVYVDGVESIIWVERDASTAGGAGSAAMAGILSLTDGECIDVRVFHDSGSQKTFTVHNLGLKIMMIRAEPG